MNKFWMALFAAAISAATAHAGCDNPLAVFINDKPVPKKPDKVIDLEMPETAEGGEFYVYFGKNKKPERIIRYDYGETFRIITKLSIGAPQDVFIARTREIYNIPFPLAGSKTVRTETDFFEYCAGKSAVAPTELPLSSDDPKIAQDVIDQAFKVDEIQPVLKDAGLKRLTSQ
jgi:hypothetical protein